MPKASKIGRVRVARSSEKVRFDTAFVDVLGEFEAVVKLAHDQRALVERELKKTKSGELGSKQHLVWMTAKLGELITKLLREGRQLQKAYAAEDMSEAETFQILINAGWKPPKGWVPPEGVTL